MVSVVCLVGWSYEAARLCFGSYFVRARHTSRGFEETILDDFPEEPMASKSVRAILT